MTGRKEIIMKKIEINDANRTKIAKTINFNEYPVLTIDLADKDEYGLKGCKVRIDNGTYSTGEKYYIKATIRAWKDEKYFSLSSSGVCLHREFTYSDVNEMLEWSAAPIIKPDQDVVIVIHDSSNKIAYTVYIVHTDSKVRPDCIDPMNIEKVDLSAYF